MKKSTKVREILNQKRKADLGARDTTEIEILAPGERKNGKVAAKVALELVKEVLEVVRNRAQSVPKTPAGDLKRVGGGGETLAKMKTKMKMKKMAVIATAVNSILMTMMMNLVATVMVTVILRSIAGRCPSLSRVGERSKHETNDLEKEAR